MEKVTFDKVKEESVSALCIAAGVVVGAAVMKFAKSTKIPAWVAPLGGAALGFAGTLVAPKGFVHDVATGVMAAGAMAGAKIGLDKMGGKVAALKNISSYVPSLGAINFEDAPDEGYAHEDTSLNGFYDPSGEEFYYEGPASLRGLPSGEFSTISMLR